LLGVKGKKAMILFDNNIVKILNDYIAKSDQYVESILLASYGLGIQFVDFSVHCNDTVSASINGANYEWQDAPNSGPWGCLGRQKAMRVNLKSPNLLNITFESGDFIDIHTSESQYESVIFNFPSGGESIKMEIY
jgi:hypothetical protein